MADHLDRLKAALADHYVIERELGRGGMATVYLAEDLKHHRSVAVKVVKPEVAAALGPERFLREIEITAKLSHPHILPLLDSGASEGFLYYVMPYVEGESLRNRLGRDKQLPIDEAVAIARHVAGALDYAHQEGVIHRDIKPANILLHRGEAVVADFGIALAVTAAGGERMTGTGLSLGTPEYMSPEQATGDRGVGTSSDVYALGAVLYEMLTGQPPHTGSTVQSVIAKLVTEQPTPPRSMRHTVSAGLDQVVMRALAKVPADRFATAGELAETLNAKIEESRTEASKARRTKVATVLGALAVIAVVTLLGILLRTRAENQRVVWATQQLREIEHLADAGQVAAAYALAEEVESIIPDDSALARVWPLFSVSLPIGSEPAGALTYRRLDRASSDEWEYLGTTPLDSVRFPERVPYRLRLEADGYGTVEVSVAALFARRPLKLDPMGSVPENAVRIPGFSISNPLADTGGSVAFQDFFMDRYEVTNREYKRFIEAGGYEKREYWRHPIINDRHEMDWDDAMQQFEDRTGRPGPSTWELGTYPDGEDDYPVGGVSWYEAAAYAQFAGKALPTSRHWQRAAWLGTGWMVTPWSNLSGAGPRPVGEDDAMNAYGLYDIPGNVREWCYNEVEGGRVTRGAAWNDPQWQVGYILPKPAFDRDPTNGLRLVTYLDHDSTLLHARGPVAQSTARDYAKEVPATPAEYGIFNRMYAYDPAPLNELVGAPDTAEHWVRQKITFDAPYGRERGGAYVFLPTNGVPPFQTIVFMPGSNALNMRSIERYPTWSFDFIMKSGRALVFPLFKGTFERDDPAFSMTFPRVFGIDGAGVRHVEGIYYKEIAIEWVKDLKRSIDFVETQSDLDAEKLGFYGHSWGGVFAPIVLAVEPRIQVAALNVAGLWESQTLPEVDPFNFISHVSVPVLMMNGKYDNVFPEETAQMPFLRLLGTAPEHKYRYVSETGHFVPREDLFRETLDWLDRYLGVPEN